MSRGTVAGPGLPVIHARGQASWRLLQALARTGRGDPYLPSCLRVRPGADSERDFKACETLAADEPGSLPGMQFAWNFQLVYSTCAAGNSVSSLLKVYIDFKKIYTQFV